MSDNKKTTMKSVEPLSKRSMSPESFNNPSNVGSSAQPTTPGETVSVSKPAPPPAKKK